MTPAQRHREACFRLHHDAYGSVSCHWHPDGHDDPLECRGRLQACHIISANRLKQLHGRAGFLAANGRPHNASLAAVDLDELLADGRNGVPGTELCHGRNEGAVLHCQPPAWFYDFVADYELEHVIENAREAA